MSDHSDSIPHFSLTLTSPSDNVLDDWSSAGAERVYVDPDADALMDGDLEMAPGNLVPVIRADHGRALASVGRWGRIPQDGATEYFRRCTGQSLGYPGLIPATEIILETESDPISIKLRDPGRMYIGCMYFQPARGALIHVVPLYLAAGPDIADYSVFQPLLIPVNALPRPGIWDFISPYGARHLRKPSEAGTLLVEQANRRTAA